MNENSLNEDFQIADLEVEIKASKNKICSDELAEIDSVTANQVAYSAYNCAWIPPEH